MGLTTLGASDLIEQRDEEPNPFTGTLVTLRGLHVTDTQFVAPRHVAPFYEIQTATPIGTTYTFVTREEPLYREALSFEGGEQRVVVSFHSAFRADAGLHVLVLDQLSADAGDVPEASPTGSRATGGR